ncbi:MAG: twin-arginine translocase TatA/TatE family subunit [Mariniblastus sp.]
MFEFETPQTFLLAFGMPGLPEMLIIGAIFLLIFGGAKLPSLMRNLGRSVNEFKTGIKETPSDASIEDNTEA